VTVDGSEQTRDLIVLPDRVVTNWWRRDGHSLAMEDLDERGSRLRAHGRAGAANLQGVGRAVVVQASRFRVEPLSELLVCRGLSGWHAGVNPGAGWLDVVLRP
jgi:hypothetical protein